MQLALLLLVVAIILYCIKKNEGFNDVPRRNDRIKLGPPYINHGLSYFNNIDPYDFMKHAGYKEYPTEFYHHPYGYYYPYDKLV